ncbi:hypothetical protein EDD15DRAFT_2199724 [Pisolithus albus]|nr:hypothetical protein EDD15DRAFT_2199724 [Pisolithus albus]
MYILVNSFMLLTCGKMKERMARNNRESPLMTTRQKRYDGLTQSYSPAVNDGARSTFPKGNVASQLWSIVLVGSNVNLAALSLRKWPKARPGDALQHVGKLTQRKDIHAEAEKCYRRPTDVYSNNLDTSEKRYDGLTQSYSPAVNDGARSTVPKGNVASQSWSIVLVGSNVNLTALSLRKWPQARPGDALQRVGKLTRRKDIHAEAPRKYLLKITLMTSAGEIDIEDDVSSSLFLLVGNECVTEWQTVYRKGEPLEDNTRSKVVDGWSKTQEKQGVRMSEVLLRSGITFLRYGTTYDELPGTSHGCYTFALQAFPSSYSRQPPTDRPVIRPEKIEDVFGTSLFERDHCDGVRDMKTELKARVCPSTITWSLQHEAVLQVDWWNAVEERKNVLTVTPPHSSPTPG